jgi:hypothetical protein
MTLATPIPCLICQQPLTLRLAKGRKSGKCFLMLVCPQDGRHFRGFINDQTYVRQVLARLEGHTPSLEAGAGVERQPHARRRLQN